MHAARRSHRLVLSCAIALLTTSCPTSTGPGYGTLPFILAALISFPPGSEPAGFQSASVVVDDPSGASVPDAVVAMNRVTLTYVPANQDYEGNVLVSPGESVTLRVTARGTTYSASVTQFTSYPNIIAPSPDAVWQAESAYSVSWSSGAPTSGAISYDVGALDPADPNGPLAWPLQVVPMGTTTLAVPPRAISAGKRLIISGLVDAVAVPVAAPGSLFVFGGFGCVPITVDGMSLSVIPDNPTVLMGTTQQFAASARSYYDGSTQDVTAAATWVSSNTAVATIGNGAGDEGTAHPLAAGTATITATWGSDSGSTAMTVPPWTLRNPGTTEYLSGVSASPSVVVAVGANGTIVTSADTVTWTQRASGTTNHLNDVVWTGTQFVAVGNAGTVLTSPDGAAWTAHTSGTGTNLSGVAWSGTQLVAVGDDNILTSPDAVSWTPRRSLGPGYYQFWSRVASSGTMFAAAGMLGTLSSPDGITWAAGLGAGSMLNSVVWAGSQFVAVGMQGGSGVAATSADGTSWTTRLVSAADVLFGVAWSGNRLVALGRRPYDYRPLILFSDNGSTWTDYISGTMDSLSSVAWCGTGFVAVGIHGLVLTIPDVVPAGAQGSVRAIELPVRGGRPTTRALEALREAHR